MTLSGWWIIKSIIMDEVVLIPLLVDAPLRAKEVYQSGLFDGS